MQKKNKIGVLVLLVIFLALGITFAETSEEAVDKGVEYEKKNKHNEAIAEFKKAIEINPKNENAYYQMGLSYEKRLDTDKGLSEYTDDFNNALSDYTKAIELSPNVSHYYVSRGRLWGKRGIHDKSIEDFNKAIEIDPHASIAYYERGHTYYFLRYVNYGALDQAIADLTKAIEITPNYSNAYYDRGISYAAKGDKARAISDFDKVIEINPKDAHSYTNVAIAYYMNGMYDKGQESIHKARALGINIPENLEKALGGGK